MSVNLDTNRVLFSRPMSLKPHPSETHRETYNKKQPKLWESVKVVPSSSMSVSYRYKAKAISSSQSVRNSASNLEERQLLSPNVKR